MSHTRPPFLVVVLVAAACACTSSPGRDRTGAEKPRVRVRQLGAGDAVTNDDFNRRAIRMPTNDAGLRGFTGGNDLSG